MMASQEDDVDDLESWEDLTDNGVLEKKLLKLESTTEKEPGSDTCGERPTVTEDTHRTQYQPQAGHHDNTARYHHRSRQDERPKDTGRDNGIFDSKIAGRAFFSRDRKFKSASFVRCPRCCVLPCTWPELPLLTLLLGQ
ncbi:PREDICTED: uncharacterized protein LOC106817374 isoform X2 [Priapulus caudatus]|uniref:Uncharacterized protein LOC106817374 isoform X2 n=1 Tax=Priapulus caudatus TaxID=37621 RepID=A0ABM1EZA1_PRICU|nr:PREDICTED: uncharacterized protein LOC106817374 isoform X2 [Priapulus caudatus]